MRARLLFGLPPLILRPRTAPLIAAALDRQMRRNAIPAIARVLQDFGVEADHVIFGHVHRLGPVRGDNPAQWGSASGHAELGQLAVRGPAGRSR